MKEIQINISVECKRCNKMLFYNIPNYNFHYGNLMDYACYSCKYKNKLDDVCHIGQIRKLQDIQYTYSKNIYKSNIVKDIFNLFKDDILHQSKQNVDIDTLIKNIKNIFINDNSFIELDRSQQIEFYNLVSNLITNKPIDSPPPIDGFIDLIKSNIKPNMKVMEVGCFDGTTSKYAIESVAKVNGEYIVVDWFKGNFGNQTGFHKYDENQDVSIEFKKNMIGYENTYKIMKMDSYKAAQYIEDESIDICFLDADHRYDGIKQDINNYLPKIKIGGILCGHDFDDTSDFKYANREYSSQELKQDMCIVEPNINPPHAVHAGVIKAVYEKFGRHISRHSNFVWSVKIS